MTASDYFTWEWEQFSDHRCLNVTPKTMGDDERWVEFFTEISPSFQSPQAYIFVDVRGKEEKITLEGFQGIIEAFKSNNVDRAVFAVTSDNSFHDMTADVFKRLSEMREYDLEIDVFLTRESAEMWMTTKM